MAAPRMPASSGSRLSPFLKKVRLNCFFSRPASVSWSIQVICLSFTRRSASGTFRGMCPLTNMSTSSSAITQSDRVEPISSGWRVTMRCSSKAAPPLTNPPARRRS